MKSRHRCEIMFICRICHVITITGVKFDTAEEHNNFIQTAWEAVLEPTDDLCDKDKETIRRRVQRMENITLEPACKNAKAEKIVLIGYHFVNELLDRDYIQIAEDSKLHRVMDALLTMIDLDDEVTQRRLVTSAKQARQWMEKLQKEGYFK